MDKFTRSRIQRLHFKRRARERAGKEIPNWGIDKVIVDIMMGRLALVPSKNRKSYEVYETNGSYFDLRGYFVFDPETEMLVTFLDKTMTPYIEKIVSNK